MKKDRNTGDLFTGFKPESEKRPITEKDICRIFNGRVLTEEEAEKETQELTKIDWRSGEALVRCLREYGVRGDIEPDYKRVEWYRRVFAEDEVKKKQVEVKNEC